MNYVVRQKSAILHHRSPGCLYLELLNRLSIVNNSQQSKGVEQQTADPVVLDESKLHLLYHPDDDEEEKEEK